MAQEQEAKQRESRPPREGHGGPPHGGPPREGRPRDDGRRDDRRGDRGDRGRPEGPPEIDLEKLISDRQRLVTDAEVLQEILHRYVAINRRDAIQPAFDALLGIVDQVLPIDRAAAGHHRTGPEGDSLFEEGGRQGGPDAGIIPGRVSFHV